MKFIILHYYRLLYSLRIAHYKYNGSKRKDALEYAQLLVGVYFCIFFILAPSGFSAIVSNNIASKIMDFFTSINGTDDSGNLNNLGLGTILYLIMLILIYVFINFVVLSKKTWKKVDELGVVTRRKDKILYCSFYYGIGMLNIARIIIFGYKYL